jgi:hypothetical protein
MKKILMVVALLALIPTATMAKSNDVNFQFGVSALWNNSINGSTEYIPAVTISDFTFGFDARLNLSIFQINALALVTPGGAYYDYYYSGGEWHYGAYEEATTIELYPGIGLKFDIAFISLGASVGMNFLFDVYFTGGEAETFQLGFHVKPFIDINIGKLSLSVYYLIMFNDLYSSALSDYEKWDGYLGASILIKF